MLLPSLPFSKIHRLLVPPLALLLTACGAEKSSFFPLGRDRSWHYDVTKSTMDGTFRQKYIVETLPEVNWQGATSVPLVSAGGEQYLYQRAASATNRVAFKPRGATAFVAHAKPQVVVPLELKLGNIWRQVSHTKLLENTGPPWETLFRIVQPVELAFKIEALDATVDVPAGSFENCLKISGYGETNVDVGNYIGRTVITVEVAKWYAQGIGLVKSVRTETTTAEAIKQGKLTLELEYSVK